MTDEKAGGGLHIDADWKTEAAREKDLLAEQERKDRSKAAAVPGTAPTSFLELLNLITMQAAVALGGVQGPGGEQIPPNPLAARHFIDLLEVLQKKTEGNLTEEEGRALDAVLYELRMQYVNAVGPEPGRTEAKKD